MATTQELLDQIRSLRINSEAIAPQWMEQGEGNQGYYTDPSTRFSLGQDVGPFQSKYNGVTDLGDGRMSVTLQAPGGHKYDTLEAIYAMDPATGQYVMQGEPVPSRQTSSNNRIRDSLEHGIGFVGTGLAAAYGASALAGLGGAGGGAAAGAGAGAEGIGTLGTIAASPATAAVPSMTATGAATGIGALPSIPTLGTVGQVAGGLGTLGSIGQSASGAVPALEATGAATAPSLPSVAQLGPAVSAGGGLLSGLNGRDVATAVGGLAGAAGAAADAGPTSATTTSKLDPQMQQMLYGTGGLLPAAQQQFNGGRPNDLQMQGAQMQADYFRSPSYTQGYNALSTAGQGLIGSGVAGNPFSQRGSGMQQPMGPFMAGPQEMGPFQQGQQQPGGLLGNLGGGQQSSRNPYLDMMGGAVVQQAAQGLNNQVLPGIRSNAMMAGGIGGSRQGIAEGNAIGQTMQGVSNSLAGLYGNAYNQDRGFDMQQRGQDQSFYTAQRGQDLQSMGMGANLFQQGQQGLQGQGQGVFGAGQMQTQAQQQPFTNFSNVLSPYSGMGGTQIQQQPGSSQWGSGLGGLLAGMQLGSNIWGG